MTTTTTMAPTRDGAREKELEGLGVHDPHVEWLDNDLVTVTMKRVDLDEPISDRPSRVLPGYHSDDECDHDDCGLDEYEDGVSAGRAAVIAELEELAGESAA